MSNNVVYRKATVADAESMNVLNCQEMPENYPLSAWESLLSNPKDCSFVAHVGDDLVGYVLCMVNMNFLYFKEEGHIASITTKTDYRKKGIARALLKLSMQCLKQHNVGICQLNVRVDNFVAQHLYRSLGFKIINTQKGYYTDGTDAYVMQAQL
jgi:ribosomal-protein-alanine acetyltransferase